MYIHNNLDHFHLLLEMTPKQEVQLYNRIILHNDSVVLKNEFHTTYKVIDAVWNTSTGGYIKIEKHSPRHSLSTDNFVPISAVVKLNNQPVW